MDTIVIETRNKSDARFLKNFSKRIGAKVIDSNELLADMAMRRLKKENLLDPDVNESKLKKALKDFAEQRGLSAHVIDVDEFLEEYEDMVFGHMIDEAMLDPDVSESEIMEILR